jgi:hypothetical protein
MNSSFSKNAFEVPRIIVSALSVTDAAAGHSRIDVFDLGFREMRRRADLEIR